MLCLGEVSCGRAGKLWYVRLSWGLLRIGLAGEVRSGLVRSVELWQGEAGRGMAGEARRGRFCSGMVGNGAARHGRWGMLSQGAVSCGELRRGKAGLEKEVKQWSINGRQ